MAFGMAALKRANSGSYTARKAIPADVREEYARLYGQRWEAKVTFDGSLSAHQTKARYGEWLSEVEGRIEAIRASEERTGYVPHAPSGNRTERHPLALRGPMEIHRARRPSGWI